MWTAQEAEKPVLELLVQDFCELQGIFGKDFHKDTIPAGDEAQADEAEAEDESSSLPSSNGEDSDDEVLSAFSVTNQRHDYKEFLSSVDSTGGLEEDLLAELDRRIGKKPLPFI